MSESEIRKQPYPPPDNRRACPVCSRDDYLPAVRCVCGDECNSEWCAGGLTVVEFVPVVEADDDW